MNKFLGKKIVEAERMNEYEATNKGFYNRHKNGDEWREGYKVVYADGSTSWSPLHTFEESYKSCDTFLDRLNIELEELQEKQDKLNEFFSTEIYKTLSKEKQNLLQAQFGAMLAYSSILIERIRLESI